MNRQLTDRTNTQANLIAVETLIRSFRNERVILDADLARVYGVPTFRLNEAVQRNIERFPEEFGRPGDRPVTAIQGYQPPGGGFHTKHLGPVLPEEEPFDPHGDLGDKIGQQIAE